MDDLTYLHHHCLPGATLRMLKLAGRDDPSMITMYDLRHSMISCEGADAAVKIRQASAYS
jgi:hypothetical protein